MVPSGSLPDQLQDLAQRSATNLTEAQAERTRRLLAQFGDMFSRDGMDLGLTGLINHVINTGDSPPIKHTPRRIASARRKM